MVIDADQNGLIDIDEFVTGCQQLHGPAKSIQMARMSHENKAGLHLPRLNSLDHVDKIDLIHCLCIYLCISVLNVLICLTLIQTTKLFH